ncbi:MAG: hypothetical protein ACRD1Z_04185, partial [Vicinamibacteria bacterium]
LGLRSLYFALASAIQAFRYLKVSLSLVLAIVGAKMLAHTWLEEILGPNFNLYLLIVVLSILALGVLAFVASPTGGGRGTRSRARFLEAFRGFHGAFRSCYPSPRDRGRADA